MFTDSDEFRKHYSLDMKFTNDQIGTFLQKLKEEPSDRYYLRLMNPKPQVKSFISPAGNTSDDFGLGATTTNITTTNITTTSIRTELKEPKVEDVDAGWEGFDLAYQ